MKTDLTMQTVLNATKSGKICLATNYLLWTEPTRQMWTDLDRHLDEFDCRLVLLTTSVPEDPLPFPVIPISFLLHDYARLFPGAVGVGGMVSAGDLERLQADCIRANRGYPPGEALPGLFACRQLFATVLNTLHPSYVLTWDPTSPIAQILQAAAQDAGVPVQGMERGFFSETLMIETRGIQAWSDLRTSWMAQDIPDSAGDAAAYERIRSYYLTCKPQKYAQADFGGGGAALRRQLGLEGKKVVVFLGSWEADGFAPRGAVYERCFHTGFPTTLEALLAMGRLVKTLPGVALVFKPHPLDQQSYVSAKLEGVQLVTDVNVLALMDAADVVAAHYTTLQFEATFYDKPVLLLARSAWWGRDAAYEVEFPEDLPAMLAAALLRRDWPRLQANAHAFITWVMDQFLIGCTDRVPARRNLRDFAHFIAATSLDARRLPPPEVRWERTGQAIEALKVGRSSGSVMGGALPPLAPPVVPFPVMGLKKCPAVSPAPIPAIPGVRAGKPMIFNAGNMGRKPAAPPQAPPESAGLTLPASLYSHGSKGQHSYP
jgi:hypothetical protein